MAVQGHHKALNGFLSKLILFSAEGPFSFAKVKELGDACSLPPLLLRLLELWGLGMQIAVSTYWYLREGGSGNIGTTIRII